VEEADDRALLADAFSDWERLCDDPEAIRAYRADLRELEAFETSLPDY
jgi:hypothetical protein